MLPALADGAPEELSGLLRADALGFLGVARLLPTGGAPLVFGGRSPGRSATSTTITANCVLPLCHRFLPGKGQTWLWMSRFATRCTVRPTTEAATPHESPLWKEVRDSRP